MKERRVVHASFFEDGDVSEDGTYADAEMILHRPIAEARTLVGKRCKVTLPKIGSNPPTRAVFHDVEFRSVFLVGDETHAHVRFWA